MSIEARPLAADIHPIFEVSDIGTIISGFVGDGDVDVPQIMRADSEHALKEHCRERTDVNYYKLVKLCRLLNIDLKDTLTYLPKLEQIDLSLVADDLLLQELLTHAEKCPNLKTVNLSDSPITDKGLSLLAQKWPQLIEIDLQRCTKISDTGMIALAQTCHQLAVANLFRTPATDRTLEALAENCPRLTSINLNRCGNLSDRAVMALAQSCPNLAKIGLMGTSITDQTLRSLALNCPQLTTLHLSDCDQLSDAAINELIQQCIHLKILVGPNGKKATADQLENFRLLATFPQLI